GTAAQGVKGHTALVQVGKVQLQAPAHGVDVQHAKCPQCTGAIRYQRTIADTQSNVAGHGRHVVSQRRASPAKLTAAFQFAPFHHRHLPETALDGTDVFTAEAQPA